VLHKVRLADINYANKVVYTVIFYSLSAETCNKKVHEGQSWTYCRRE